MAAGWDISASAASGISDAETFNNEAGIYFDSMSQGIHSGDTKAGDVTPTAARSLTSTASPVADTAPTVGSATHEDVGNSSMTTVIAAVVLGVFVLISALFNRR